MNRDTAENTLNSVVSVSEILAYLREDCYLGKAESAKYLGLSVRTLEDRLDSIPHFRLGTKKLLFKRSELDRWMEQFRETTTANDIKALADTMLGKIRGDK